MDGEFINGWIYEEGKIIKKSRKNNSRPNGRVMLPVDPQEYVTYVTTWYERYCNIHHDGSQTCSEWHYLYQTSVTYCPVNNEVGGGGVEYVTTTVDCAGVTNGTAYIGECGVCIGGITGLISCKDPCAERIALSNQLNNSTLSNHNSEILSNTIASGNEYGAEKNLQSLSQTNWNNYVNTPVRTNNHSNRFQPNFSWNSTQGYTIGVSHGHPSGGGPSPSDAIWAISNLNNPSLLASGDIQFYKDNVSTTMVTNQGIFVIAPLDWTSLQARFNEFHSSYYTHNVYLTTENTMNDDYRDLAWQYQLANPYASYQDITAFALMAIFEGAINLYFASPGSMYFTPLEIYLAMKVASIPCNGQSNPPIPID